MKSSGHLSLGAIAMGWFTRTPGIHAMPLIQALPRLCSQDSVTIARNVSSDWPWQEYISSSARPPYLEINATGEELAPGLILFDPQTGINSESYIPDKAPFIMTDAGDLVWSGPVIPDASNFRVQKLFGQPVITYWAGSGGAAESSSASHGYGHIVIHNSSYDQIGVFCPKLNLTLPPGTSAPCQADVHESLITEDNTILITAYNTTNADLRDLGGSEDGWVLDSLVLEIDLHTSEILFSWSPLAHVPISDTKLSLDGAGANSSDPFDFFHTNSIQPFEGNYLINSRSTWSTYLVNRSGDIIWKINGQTGGDFGSLPEGGNFSWEHFGRIQRTSDTHLQLGYFANNNGGATTSYPSVGLELLLTVPPSHEHPPQLLKNLSDPLHPVVSLAMGSHDVLSNGNHFLGYGIQPVMKEFGPHNPQGRDVRWSARYNHDDGGASYRTYKSLWKATPSSQPLLHVKRLNHTHYQTDGLNGIECGSSKIRGYVSWNGATQVKYYILYVGNSTRSMKAVGIFPKVGFETKFAIPENKGQSMFQVDAVEDSDLGVTRRSAIMELCFGRTRFL
ncbi:uncharacterized protein N7484_002504 [Penicillium longicatenatum]|uniref:uncharacterized protein n=1 Tax=Penicillium longicatenatum TaxID=1561947 RepID=UPI0025465C00|nr:uncharacterized protein N7484_002504 [Penicillium longicatenatum]KAJ5658855.1 hypothetical protein N7484_002504 [Penicillium longicatenatum]